MNALYIKHFFYVLWVALSLAASSITAAPLNMNKTPLVVSTTVAPLTMLVMGRDHKLYYEAYNDASDLNGDGIIDNGYKPNTVTYYGYFDSYKCYSYSSSKKRFNPSSITANKKCSGSLWSGDFLNYLTTSRIDALRKVLFGGYRYNDSEGLNVLERAYIPQDAHSWGKEYTSVSNDGYNISDYTPLSLPSNGKRHLFASTTLLNDNQEKPLLRVASNQNYRVWEWLSIERPVADSHVATGNNNRVNISNSISDYVVRVKVCDTSVGLETNCRVYANGKYKPTGLLQEFGENDSMNFGLITGSYGKNISGGVLRKNVKKFDDEIHPVTGKFTNTVGIIKTINKLKIKGFGSNHYYNSNCGWITTRLINNGECRMWGNPIGEMMYEGLRYFAGKATPTAAFVATGGDDASLGLPTPNWQDPYQDSNNPYCAQPNLLVISDINPTYDSDELPGSSFSSFFGDLSGMNVTSLGQTIWNGEYNGSKSIFIGQAGNNADGAPTVKTASSFGNLRGLVPEDPNSNGSYYSASVAYHGWKTDLHSVQNDQKVHTYAVALASPLPRIEIPVNGQKITLVPFAKSVGGCLGVNGSGPFQPTNTIVDFYVESITPTSGSFRINFEDVQQGADHDMDAIVKYQYAVNSNNTVTVTLTSDYAAGCVIQHIGYVISGTTADGVYLEVRDSDTSSGSDINYFLDTPNNGSALPLVKSRTFTPGNTSATFLENPLWYAAKWGGFTDLNNNNKPDLQAEYDADNDGVPDNYFYVTNPLKLRNQLYNALKSIVARTSSFAQVAINTNTLTNNTKLYQVRFKSGQWSGELLAYALDPVSGAIKYDGTGEDGSLWEAGKLLNSISPTTRRILTFKPSSKIGIPLRWPLNISSPGGNELDISQILALNKNPISLITDSLGEQRLLFLRGDRSQEQANGGDMRTRDSLLGDVVNAAPLFINSPRFPYNDVWPGSNPENSHPYSTFRTAKTNRAPMILIGSNDGMLHIFDANTGQEKLAYIPSFVLNNLTQLTNPQYTHHFFVDATPNAVDVFFGSKWHTVVVGGVNLGGQGIYSLDVTDPSLFSEALASNIVLWEFTDADDADLGFTYSQPAIVRLANGKWAAVFGNGFNNTASDAQVSTTGNAVVYIVDIETGNLIKKFDTGVGMSADPLNTGRPNGMATTAVADMNGDGIGDYIYGGDLFGNFWKIDIRGASTNAWGFSFNVSGAPAPLFVAKDANGKRQPITTRPEIRRDRNVTGEQLLITLGTGKYLEDSDKTNLDIQSLYVLHDNHTTTITGRSQLLQQNIVQESVYTRPDNSKIELRVSSNNILSNTHRGWYMDLIYNNNPLGERVIFDTNIISEKLIVSTLIPSTDPCSFGGTGWLMELSLKTGQRLQEPPFDLNQDKQFNNNDLVGYLNNNVPPSGIKSTVGIIAAPVVLSDQNVEYKYLAGSSGKVQQVTENPKPVIYGRQSWYQIK